MIDVAKLTDLVQRGIDKATFDRERFSVKAVQSTDGTSVEVHTDTKFTIDDQGHRLTSCSVTSVERLELLGEDIGDWAKTVAEMSVSMLADEADSRMNGRMDAMGDLQGNAH